MTDEAAEPMPQHSAAEFPSGTTYAPRRSISHGSAEHDRAVSALEDGMDQLRRAQNALRHASHAFHRARRDVTECELAVVAANARLQRVPWPRLTISPGSV